METEQLVIREGSEETPLEHASGSPEAVVFRNQWKDSLVTLPDDWKPSRSVSVVVPSLGGGDRLKNAVRSLMLQDYPRELLEIIVVDDNSPTWDFADEVNEGSLRVIHRDSGWGQAGAFDEGVRKSEGEIILRIDADLVVAPDHVTEHLRLYDQVADCVTKGEIRFTQDWPARMFDLSDSEFLTAVTALRERTDLVPQWVESVLGSTDDFNTAGPRVFSSLTGACCSFTREAYDLAGGADRTMILGEDTELGYRLAQLGVVFVPQRASVGIHLGLSAAHSVAADVREYSSPYYAQRIPVFQADRRGLHLRWQVPRTLISLVDSGSDGSLGGSLQSILESNDQDFEVEVVSCRKPCPDVRHDVRKCENREYDSILELVRCDSRFRVVASESPGGFPSPYQLHLPSFARVGRQSLSEMTNLLDQRNVGALAVVLEGRDPNEGVVLFRTAAIQRCIRNRLVPSATLLEAVRDVWGVWWGAADDYDIAVDLEAREKEAE